MKLSLVQCCEFTLKGLLYIFSDVERRKKNIVKTAVWIIYSKINAASGKFRDHF
jgi:hypothetical protein